MTEFTKEYIRSVRMCSYLMEPPASEVIEHLCDEIERLQQRIAELEAKVESAGDLLESISVWFWKTQGLQPDPMWVDQFKSVCNLFEPTRKDNDETSCL